MKTQEDPYLPTDSLAFYLAEVPTLSFFTGSHAQYHTPEDKAELINYASLIQILGLVERISLSLVADRQAPVTYRKVEATEGANQGQGHGMRLYLGTIPDYAHDGGAGVMISGTSKDSPAEKAGVKAGDLIVELGGMKIQNLNDYVYCLQALKANQRIALRVVRRGEEKSLEITPVLRAR